MTTSLSRRAWLQRSAMAAAILPVSQWYHPDRLDSILRPSSSNGPIRLNSNENAYGPSEAARKAILNSLSDANRYPWDAITKLRGEIAKKEGLTADHVLITAGSTELLGLAGLTFGLDKGELLACHPTFDFLMLYAEKMGCTWARTPLDENYQYDLNALSQKVGSKTRLIFICNPNNPTGIEIPGDQLAAFCAAYATNYPVYVDEAYIELSPGGRASSMARWIEKYPKLIVGRTFSKVYGLAGMRIGYALAQPETINQLNNFHTGRSMSISVLAAEAAMACLHDSSFESFSQQKIAEGRKIICKAFKQWNVDYLQSATNFVFFKNDQFKMDPVAAMEKENILIRSYNHTPGWTRVSIGTTEENEAFVKAAGKYV